MPYTWSTTRHVTTAGRQNLRLELWSRKPDDWVHVCTRDANTLDDAYDVAKFMRATVADFPEYGSHLIIAAVRFTPRGHHRLVTWDGTYTMDRANA